METNLSKFEIATCKRTAANVRSFRTKRMKLLEKIAAMQTEVEHLEKIIDAFEAPIKEMTGGLTSEQVLNNLSASHIEKDETLEDSITTVEEALASPETSLESPKESTGDIKDDNELPFMI